MPKQEGLKPIGHSIKIIIDKIKAEREAKRNKNKPIRTQPKIPGLAQGGLQKSYRGDDPMKRRKKPKSKSPKGLGPQQSALPKKQGAPQSPGGIGRFGPEGKDSKSKGAGPYGEKPPQLKKSKKERREKYRKEVQKHGGNVIYADEWDKIDPGLKKGIGLKKGGVKKAFGGQLMRQPTAAQTLNVMQQNAAQKLGMKKGGKIKTPEHYLVHGYGSTYKPKRKSGGGELRKKGGHVKKAFLGKLMEMFGRKKEGRAHGDPSRQGDPGLLRKEAGDVLKNKFKGAGGGISGKSTVGALRKKYGPLKKGIRLKGKGSSFMKEYRKRVYGRAKGGSMVQGAMKRARGSGAAIKGTRFQGTF